MSKTERRGKRAVFMFSVVRKAKAYSEAHIADFLGSSQNLIP